MWMNWKDEHLQNANPEHIFADFNKYCGASIQKIHAFH
jgi:hypothetical protein